MADIATRAADIKRQSAQKRVLDHVDMLAQLFGDDDILDSGTANALQKRLATILGASADARNGGLTHFSGILAGWTDTGFRNAFLDPWGSASNNQVGHFLTAVDMGFNPKRTYDFASNSTWFSLSLLTVGTGIPKEESICVRLIVGHEQYPDNGWNAGTMQALAPKDADIQAFYNAVKALPNDAVLDLDKARGSIITIPVGTGTGNSIQDLLLSLFGYKFGSRIRLGTLDNRDEAAQWVRANLGESLPDVPNVMPPDTAVG